MLSHDRRRILHWGVTAHPTAEWTAQQLRYAFLWDTASRYLLRDRDGCYGEPFPQFLIFNECGLRRILKSYFQYYEKSCTHLGLAKDAPIPRPVQPPSLGRVIAFPQVGGLHHRYERQAA